MGKFFFSIQSDLNSKIIDYDKYIFDDSYNRYEGNSLTKMQKLNLICIQMEDSKC